MQISNSGTGDTATVRFRDVARVTANAVVDLAVVVPVYNNEDSIEELADRVHAALRPCNATTYRVVFVVDASPDDSWNVVVRFAQSDNQVDGILLQENVGQHAAVLTGFRQVEARYYALMDADLQDPPELLPDLLKQAKAIAGTAFAAREGNYQAATRMVTSRLFKGALRLWIGLPATYGTFLVMPQTVVRAMLALQVDSPQIPIMAWVCSERTTAVPFQRATRPNGQSSYSVLARFRAAWRAFRCAWSVRNARH